MCTWRWFYRCTPKGCKGSAGHVRCLLDHAARTPLPLKQQGAMSTWTTLHCTYRNLHNGSTRACRFENKYTSNSDNIARTYVRTTCCLPFPQRREGRRGQASSHTLPAISHSPSLLLLSSDNICTPKFIKSMTLFLPARLE